MTALGVLEFIAGDPQQWHYFMGFILGLLFLMMGIWEWKNPYVTVTEDTLTVHRILLKNKAIPLSDLTQVTCYAGDVRLFTSYSKTTLDRSKISTEEHKALMAFLRQAVPQAVNNL
jgi:hypothetical protein